MTTTIPTEVEIEITQIRLEYLTPHPDNVRRDVGDIEGLTDSIRETGILEPLIVLPTTLDEPDGTHTIVAGHRRHAAALAAGLTTAPCIIRDLTEVEVVKAMLAENLQRSEISAVEEAIAYQRLIDWDTSIDDIAATVGRSTRTVRARLGLLAWPDEVLDLVEAGDLPLSLLADLQDWAGHPDAPRLLVRHRAEILRSAHPLGQLRHLVYTHIKTEVTKKTVADLEGAGFTIVTGPAAHSWPTMLRHPVRLDGFKDWETSERIAHTTEPCHAIILGDLNLPDDWTELTVETAEIIQHQVCTDPDRHVHEGPGDPEPGTMSLPHRNVGSTGHHVAQRHEPTPEELQAEADWAEADEKRRTWWRQVWIFKSTGPVDSTFVDLARHGRLDARTGTITKSIPIPEESDLDGNRPLIDVVAGLLPEAADPIAAAFRALLTSDLVWTLPDVDEDSWGWLLEEAGLSARLLLRMIDDGYEPHHIELAWLENQKELDA